MWKCVTHKLLAITLFDPPCVKKSAEGAKYIYFEWFKLPDETIEQVTATIANIKNLEIRGIARDVSGVRLASKNK